MFESVRIGPAARPLQVKFVFDDGSPREANGRYLELAVGMLFLIPTYLRDRDNLDVQVEWRGTPLRQYHYEIRSIRCSGCRLPGHDDGVQLRAARS